MAGTFDAKASVVPKISTSSNIKRAFVAWLRANTELKAALVGGIHEGFAPEKATYPLLKFDVISAPFDYLWGSLMIFMRIDVWIYDRNVVEADNLDGLVARVLDDAALPVDGQTTLICRREMDLRSTDTDEEGRKVYGVGASYVIETDQPH
jgi:hypothetical protein